MPCSRSHNTHDFYPCPRIGGIRSGQQCQCTRVRLAIPQGVESNTLLTAEAPFTVASYQWLRLNEDFLAPRISDMAASYNAFVEGIPDIITRTIADELRPQVTARDFFVYDDMNRARANPHTYVTYDYTNGGTA